MVRQSVRRRYTNLRKNLSLLLVLLFSVSCLGNEAIDADVYLYLKENSAFEKKLLTSLEKKFKSKNLSLKPLYQLDEYKGHAPVIYPRPKASTLIPDNIENVIGVFNSYLNAKRNNEKVRSHIITSPSIDAQLALVNQLYFNTDRKLTVGLILSKENKISDSEVSLFEKSHNIKIKIEYTEDTPLKALSKLGKIDALLALPDTKVFNKKTTSTLIKTAYSKEIPMIGFWSGMVKHGASATTYYELEHISEAIISSVVDKTYLKEKFIWPSESNLSKNAPVIKSLSLNDSLEIKTLINKGVNE